VEVKGGFASPLQVTSAEDGSGRLFVVERPGRIKILQGGQVSLFLDISERVRSLEDGGGSEEGLLSVVFAPGFGSTASHFYVYYTNTVSDNQVSRFFIGPNPDQADPASEEPILTIPHPNYTIHNGGQLAFGPDGYLYIASGDGGPGGDPNGNAQNPGLLLGKLLRIGVEHPPAGPVQQPVYLPIVRRGPGSSLAYQIPPDNPFVNDPAYRPEIWALGLRNPWRFSFDRVAGDLWTGDVGDTAWDEIDYQPASSSGGENYGWNVLEGNVCFADPGCNPAAYTAPVWVYDHSGGCTSVTGGFVYRGGAYPNLQGIYYYSDYCSGKIWGLRFEDGAWQNHLFLDTPYNIASLGESDTGELYLVDIGAGTIYQLVESP
jgi:glucose/arabinose dehydrogenase